MMGCSNPHPHGQIWANQTVPLLPSREEQRQKEYFASAGASLLVEYVQQELQRDERIIFQNDSFVALVPYWAVWPFETMICPREPLASIEALSARGRRDLADALRRMSVRFDNLFQTSFPYSMGIHQQPVDGVSREYWQMHIHYYPPLLRSATVRKFMVGYEMLGMPQRDITAEQAAQRLRECPEQHYTQS
jgi:UDPglucose--hexose-1-phosphate uridylyltransferase